MKTAFGHQASADGGRRQRERLLVCGRVQGVGFRPSVYRLAHEMGLSGMVGNDAGGAFIGQHGSWNREPPVGYKVIFVPFTAGRPTGTPEDVLTGFLDVDGNAQGRPVGVAIDRTGALLIADDVGNTVWRITPDTATAGIK